MCASTRSAHDIAPRRAGQTRAVLRSKSVQGEGLAWDLWFDLAQATNDFDPPYTHGVFMLCEVPLAGGAAR